MTKAFDSALRLLARREHGARELADKLVLKGFATSEVSEAIAECQRLGLQSDERFVDSLCRARIRQGSGPIKISQELQSKHIDRALIAQALEQEQDNWVTYALAVWQKKYKNQDDVPFDELQKRQRFLLYRGFSTEIIAGVIALIRG
ncbi:Regulatory protein RecX [Legionella massiliensis]|uniref:Regulatory protein RecX n=1 Tax=Legionella massiliensis TaxID=1034943 RepID=A0A078L358_9GAMM|nr:recombination regulator RecX [Legionella massiliensis]CDZ78544.1 Regulatory protein RecX [Legionella massiliensis]CEE14282.1 Regulatory protein RecX [Legionella massiliensis]